MLAQHKIEMQAKQQKRRDGKVREVEIIKLWGTRSPVDSRQMASLEALSSTATKWLVISNLGRLAHQMGQKRNLMLFHPPDLRNCGLPRIVRSD